MRRQHSPKNWRCLLCDKTGEAVEDCTSHLKEEHAMDDTQSSKVAKVMMTEWPVYESCPFCGFGGDKGFESEETFHGMKRKRP
jgi:rubredoxin